MPLIILGAPDTSIVRQLYVYQAIVCFLMLHRSRFGGNRMQLKTVDFINNSPPPLFFSPSIFVLTYHLISILIAIGYSWHPRMNWIKRCTEDQLSGRPHAGRDQRGRCCSPLYRSSKYIIDSIFGSLLQEWVRGARVQRVRLFCQTQQTFLSDAPLHTTLRPLFEVA